MSLTDTVSKIDRLTDAQRDCIEICSEATQVCEWCADECLGDPEMTACARRCRDVADIASVHARLMARGSPVAEHLAEVCAAACEACAEECARHDASHCQVCAEVVAECAERCREMAV